MNTHSDNKTLHLVALQVVQPVGTFYLTVMNPQMLTRVSFSDERRLMDEVFEEYTGIQRELDPKRVKELQKYVQTIDASFPTGIIIAISEEGCTYDEGLRELSIPDRADIARVLDGQHRIAGLSAFDGPSFELPVIVFLDTDLEDQAHIFGTINLAQTKVSKSLAYELYDLATKRSPQKTCHVAAKVLNGTAGSPFFQSIKILGKSRTGRFETLSQANIVGQVLPLVSTDPIKDRDDLRQDRKLAVPDAAALQKMPFRQLFVEAKDTEIVANLWNFFKAVERRWPTAWTSQDEGIIIRRSTGFMSFMRLLKASYLHLSKESGDEVIRAEQYARLLEASPLIDGDFNKEQYIPGSTGVSRLSRKLLEHSGMVPVAESELFDTDDKDSR